MKDEKLIEVIRKAAEEASAQTVIKLQKSKLMKDKNRTPYQKTESLLYNYPKFKEIIKEREEVLSDDMNFFPKGKSADIVRYSKQPKGTKDIEKVIKENHDAYEISLERTKRSVKLIDDALNKIKSDPYYGIIPAKYFELKTHEQIAGIYSKDTSTITKNKSRLINELKINLFSDEAIEELFI
jgi:Txe/YoeB family toxin of Txe-Axe toxin-antitoxin module